MLGRLAPLAKRVVLTLVNSNRTLPVADQLALCRQSFPKLDVTACSSLGDAMKTLAAEDLLLITGSIYLVGEAMEWLHLSPVPAADEKGLNEWTTAAPSVKSR